MMIIKVKFLNILKHLVHNLWPLNELKKLFKIYNLKLKKDKLINKIGTKQR